MLQESLKEWFKRYIKHKDIFDNKLERFNEDNKLIKVIYKNDEITALIEPIMQDIQSIEEILKKNEKVILVTFNNKKNLNFVVGMWQRLAEFKNLKIIFSNPETQGDDKWIIIPYTHNKITSASALEAGLKSMFNSVEEVESY
ncbi:MAG: hypothetical protein ACQESF_02990 [Nanobdellota archaeon]